MTISRETGAGAAKIANAVAQQLDCDRPGEDGCPWAVFDRNLVKKILEDDLTGPTDQGTASIGQTMASGEGEISRFF